MENANSAAHNVFEDLSIEKKELEIAKAKEEAIPLSIGDGLIVSDKQGRIVLVNRVAERLLGREAKEMVGKLYFEVFQMEDENGKRVPREKGPISIALATGTVMTTTSLNSSFYYVRKNGTKFPVISPFRNHA